MFVLVDGDNRSVLPLRKIAFVLGMTLFVCGCTGIRQYCKNGFKVGPNYQLPPAPVASEWIDCGKDPRICCKPTDLREWWTVFHDPVLDSLIATAVRQNLDLKTAGTRVFQSIALRNVAIGNLFPQSQGLLGAFAHAQLSKDAFPLGNTKNIPTIPGQTTAASPFGRYLNIWTTGFNASWEIDFWGRYRRSIESAGATLDASVEAYNAAMVTLLAEVATNYVQIRTFQRRLEYARHNVEIQRGSLKIAEARSKVSVGAAPALDVAQTRSNLAQTEAIIPPLEIGLRQANNRLCVLLGVPVKDLVACLTPAPIPTAPSEVVVGIPADLLRRRPDVRRAERQVAAQSAEIGIAEAELYPRFVLFGFVGFAAHKIGDLFASKSFTGLIIPNFQWQILNYGRLLNNIRDQKALFQERVLQYQQTVLQADQEAESAIIAYTKTREQTRYLQESTTAAEQAVRLVEQQFQTGTADFNRVYTTEATLVTQQDQLAQAEGNIALNLIAVYRALGGGWENGGHNEVAPGTCLEAGPFTPPESAHARPPAAPPLEPAPVEEAPKPSVLPRFEPSFDRSARPSQSR